MDPSNSSVEVILQETSDPYPFHRRSAAAATQKYPQCGGDLMVSLPKIPYLDLGLNAKIVCLKETKQIPYTPVRLHPQVRRLAARTATAAIPPKSASNGLRQGHVRMRQTTVRQLT